MPSEFICKSCGKELKKSYALCFNCHTSDNLKRCPFIKRSNGEQCKLQTVKKGCIFHNEEINRNIK